MDMIGMRNVRNFAEAKFCRSTAVAGLFKVRDALPLSKSLGI